MTTFEITIDDKSEYAKGFVTYLKGLKFVKNIKKISIEKIPNSETLKAIKDAEDGKLIFYGDYKDYIKKTSEYVDR